MPIGPDLCFAVMNVDPRLLAPFVAVADELSFSRAAAGLSVTQPALTRQIAQLERLVGARLFDRTTRRVALTPAGEALLGPARRALVALDEGVAAARRVAHGSADGLRVGLGTCGNVAVAPDVIALFEARAGRTVRVTRGATGSSVERLLRRAIDVAFLRPPLYDADGIAVRSLLREPMVVVLPEDHDLAALDRVPRTALREEPMVWSARERGRGSWERGLAAIWDDAAEGARHVAVERPDEEMMVTAVGARLGFTLAYESRMRFLNVPGVVARPLDPPLAGELAIAWRADDPNPDVAAFVSLAVERINRSEQPVMR